MHKNKEWHCGDKKRFIQEDCYSKWNEKAWKNDEGFVIMGIICFFNYRIKIRFTFV